MNAQLRIPGTRSRALCAMAAMLLCAAAGAQGVGINADGAAPEPAAVLDIDAAALPLNAKKGVLLPEAALTSSLWSWTPLVPVGPFNGHGEAAMTPALWVHNTNTTTTGTVSLVQYTVAPGLHWFTPASGTSPSRWVRQEGKVVPLHHHPSTGTVSVNAPATWTPIPGMESFALDLRVGDRVYYTASGAFGLAEPTPPEVDYGYANAAARVVLNGSTVLKQTATSLNGEAMHVFASSCSGWLPWLCAGVPYYGVFGNYLHLQSWKIIGAYDATSNGVHTFSVQLGRPSGKGLTQVLSGGTTATNPHLRGTLNIEVVRP